MKNQKCIAIVLAFVLMFFPFGGSARAYEFDDDAEFLFSQSESAAYEQGVALVDVSDAMSAEDVATTLGELGFEASLEEVVRGVVRLELASPSMTEAAVNALLERGIATAAQPNYEYDLIEDEVTDEAVDLGEEPSIDANDDEPLLGTQATTVDDPMSDEQWGLPSVRASMAWNLIKTNRKVTVAVMDLGCDVYHADLKENIVDPYNSVDCSTNVSPVTTSDIGKKHGTHVAGIIGAVANNGIGIAGVSYNANVMPIKVVSSNGMAYTDALLRAYDYVISKRSSRNVRVVNLSMGSAKAVVEDDALVQKIKEAYNLGIVTVCAAGNRGASNTGSVPYTCYPSDFSWVVSVINLSQDGSSSVSRYETSNYNYRGERTKDIAAPGTDILSTVPNDLYASLNGTSMAAPMVAGVLALEFCANPSLTSTGAVERLYASTTKLSSNDFDLEYGWGEVNAYEAVRAALYGPDATRLASVRASMAAEGIPSPLFIDVDGSTPHSKEITWLAEQGISSGWQTRYGQQFRPYGDIKRGDLAAFLFRLAVKWGMVSDDWQATSAQMRTFSDVNSSVAHAREIWWLAQSGIVQGWVTSQGREFRPYQSITRADIAAMLYRLAQVAGISVPSGTVAFIDVNTSTPHYSEILWLGRAGISQGWSVARGREYRPYALTCRADMAAFLYRLDAMR